MFTYQPEPFNKYLYSGACYIQIAECYKLIHQWLKVENELNLEERIITELREAWLQLFYANFPVAMTKLSPDITRTAMSAKEEEILFKALSNYGTQIATELLSKISDDAMEESGLTSFFRMWAASCSKAYADLIRSDTLIKSVTKTLNKSLDCMSKVVLNDPADK